MKNETNVKIIVLLIIGLILFTIPVNVFAETNDPINLEDWEQLEIEDDDKTTDPTPTTPTTPTNPTPTPAPTPAPSTQNENESLPHAGLAEDTMMVVAIMVLGITAVYAYRKINEYNNI